MRVGEEYEVNQFFVTAADGYGHSSSVPSTTCTIKPK